jgi:hypothetical protein
MTTESREAKKGTWDKKEDDDKTNNGDSPDENNFRKAKYMDMSKPGKYCVRLVGDHVEFRKHFKPYMARVQDEDKDIDPAWQAGWYPPEKSAVNVINKTAVWDFEKNVATGVGTLEILEKGPSVFKHFKNYKTLAGIIPSGKKGPNFIIEVTIPKGPDGKPNKLKTDYAVQAIPCEAPFTEEEKQMVKAAGGLFNLPVLFKSTSAAKMKEMWDALTPEQKIAPKKVWDDKDKDKDKDKKKEASKIEAEAPAPMNETMSDSPADLGDDLFDTPPADDSDSTNLF